MQGDAKTQVSRGPVATGTLVDQPDGSSGARQPELLQIEQEIQRLHHRMLDVADRAEQVERRVLGPRPHPSGSIEEDGMVSAAPDYFVPNVMDGLAEIQDQIERTSAALYRLAEEAGL